MNTQPQPDLPDSNNRLVIRLLGQLQVALGAQPIAKSKWRLRKSKSLVKLLALAPGHRLHREQVLDMLWPDLPPDDAAHNLHQVLYIARRALDPTGKPARHLQLQDEVLSLGPPESLWIDVEAFEVAAQIARQERNPTAYRAALDLYTGDLLPDDRYEDWAALRRDTLHQTYLALLVELADLYEERSEYVAGIEMATLALGNEPALEAAHRSLMRLYARSSRQQQALQQYQRLREALRRELDAEPDVESERLYREIAAGRPRQSENASQTGRESTADAQPPPPVTRETSSAPDAPASVRSNLPLALDSFVGREPAIADIKRLLTEHRLVTLTGAGGCGKTRLALELAGGLTTAHRDGVWLVEFAALSDGALVPQQVADTLGVREVQGRPLNVTLDEHLQGKQMLLLFDNCEHLIDACARLAEFLLRTCASLRILATSREALRIAGETNYRVPSLSLPESGSGSTPETLAASEAARLFVDRALAARSDFAVNSANAVSVALICARLEGMPLAIELAAARVCSMPVDEIAARLDDALQLLTSGPRTAVPRQRTLAGVFDWSYQLLTEAEKSAFRRLCVFAGGWTVAAAEVVCTDEAGADLAPAQAGQARDLPLLKMDVFDLLTRLADQSLVVMDEQPGGIRYRLLEPVRQYAERRLTEAGEREQVREQHFAFWLAYAQLGASKLFGPEQALWLDRLERDHPNLRAALDFVLAQRRVEDAKRLCRALARFWARRAHFNEGHEWLARALELAPAGSAVRADLLYAAGLVYSGNGELAPAMQAASEGLEIYRRLKDRRGMAEMLTLLGNPEVLGAAARPHSEEAVALWRELNDPIGLAEALSWLGHAAHHVGDLSAGRAALEESLALRGQMQDDGGIAWCLYLLAQISAEEGKLSEAASLVEQSLLDMRRIGDRFGTTLPLSALAQLAQVRGEYEAAERLYGEVVELCRETHAVYVLSHSLINWAQIAIEKGELDRALALNTEGLNFFAAQGVRFRIFNGLSQLARIAAERGHSVEAMRILGAANAAHDQVPAGSTEPAEATLTPVYRLQHERNVTALRARYSGPEYIQAWAEGHRMSTADAIAEARRLATPDPTSQPERPAAPAVAVPAGLESASLTPRELEVLRLVAMGLTNEEIAQQLVLSRRTVHAHLRSIFSKLDVTTRTAAARVAIENKLV